MTTPTETESPSTRIRQAREARGWTQEQLGARAGLDQQTVWRHETRGGLSARAIAGYADALQVSEEWILYGSGVGPGHKEIVRQYLKSDLGRSASRDVRRLLRRVSYSSLGVRHVSLASVHRVRELIEMNRILESTMSGDDLEAAESKPAGPRR